MMILKNLLFWSERRPEKHDERIPVSIPAERLSLQSTDESIGANTVSALFSTCRIPKPAYCAVLVQFNATQAV